MSAAVSAPRPPPVEEAPGLPAPAPRYVGLATRIVAFAIDAGLISIVAFVVELAAALIIELMHLPGAVKSVLVATGAAAYLLWTVGYFVWFWSTTGQTPGNRVMRIRVVTADLAPLGARRALVRWVGVVLAALPLFAGFVRILFDSRRRGFHDRLAGTVVVEDARGRYSGSRVVH